MLKTLFLIDGATGTGKSDMLRYLTSKRKSQATFVPKYTTRHRRPSEKGTRIGLRTPESVKRFLERTQDPAFYWYKFGDRDIGEEYYGLYKTELQAALREYPYVFAIVRDFETASRIRSDFSQFRTVTVFIYSDGDLIERRLRREGFDAKEIDFRVKRRPLAWADYVKYSRHYDEIIINSGDKLSFELLLEALFDKYTQAREDALEVAGSERYALTSALVGYRREMEKRLEVFPFDRNVFLMMRFRNENRLVYQFIRRQLEAKGLNCVRADEPEWDITRNTYNPVAVLYCCKYGIALFDAPEIGSDYSPNVAYELGIMHNQRKECLILKNTAIKKVPFDLVKELYVEYTDSIELEGCISQWIQKIAGHGVGAAIVR